MQDYVRWGRAAVGIALLLVGAALTIGPSAKAEDPASTRAPRAFPTAEALAEALIAAAENNDDDALRALAGSQSADVVQSGGDPSVAKVRAEFAANARVFWKLADNEDGSKTLVVGDARWPFPMPFVSSAAGWTVDVAAGREEMRMRRIGQNELDAIRLCRAYARAQEEYHAEDRDGDGVREYAQRIKSTPGTKDGLYWPTGEDGDVSPFGPLVASIEDYLQDRQEGDPVAGYYWKILTWQGPRAPGGQHSYVINGNMIAGFALVGVPARYGETGVMTFLVSHHGQVFEKDLGGCTSGVLRTMNFYDPDATWHEVED